MCVWVKKRSALRRLPSSSMIFLPNNRIPVPASTKILREPQFSSKEVVFPPYFTVPGPGQGMLPRVPHSLSENVDELGMTNDYIFKNFEYNATSNINLAKLLFKVLPVSILILKGATGCPVTPMVNTIYGQTIFKFSYKRRTIIKV
jgi:hypothetical protein